MRTSVILHSFTIERTNDVGNLLTVTNASDATFRDLHLRGGAKSVNILAIHHNSMWSGITITSFGDYGIDLLGDTATAELWFTEIDISGGDLNRDGTAGIRIVKTTATDQGGFYFNNVLVAQASRRVGYGMFLVGTAITAGHATSPVFLRSCQFDGADVPFRAVCMGGIFATQSWFSCDIPANDVIQFDTVSDVQFVQWQTKGGTNGFAFRGGTSKQVRLVSSRTPEAAEAYFLESANVVTGLIYDAGSVFAGIHTRLTNNRTWLAASSMNRPTRAASAW